MPSASSVNVPAVGAAPTAGTRTGSQGERTAPLREALAALQRTVPSEVAGRRERIERIERDLSLYRVLWCGGRLLQTSNPRLARALGWRLRRVHKARNDLVAAGLLRQRTLVARRRETGGCSPDGLVLEVLDPREGGMR